MLDKQRSSSTIKVYTAARAAFHAPIAGKSVGRECGNSIFPRRQQNESPMSSYSSTLGLTNRTKGPKRAPVWTIAILEPQSTLVGNRPAVSTGVGQASRRPAGPFCQPCLPGIRVQRLQGRPETKAGLCTLGALHPVQSPGYNTLQVFPPDVQPGVPALTRQGPENIHCAFCLVQKVRTAFCWLR